MKNLLVGLALLVIPAVAVAATPKPVKLDGTSLFQTSNAGVTYTCGLINQAWLAGKLDKKGLFLSFNASAKIATANAKKSSGSKKTKYLNAAKKAKAQAKLGNPVCGTGNSPGSGPTPAPTVPAGSGNFDLSGNVTETGRALFKIPSGLVANISSGRLVFNQKCSGCHGEHQNKSFTTLRSDTAQFPMGFTAQDLPDSELAHITAFLNRFRQ